jgi:hypothetical protein
MALDSSIPAGMTALRYDDVLEVCAGLWNFYLANWLFFKDVSSLIVMNLRMSVGII